jgi:hypothetical protein
MPQAGGMPVATIVVVVVVVVDCREWVSVLLHTH